ncbi:hypothetical protein D7Y13_36860 [Corallococcus praedator]|uniref:DUF4198 domain-containing protein n=1 Tax=Corallococcus praedator TaxID=2316724 RepID=A0ABX9Q666_9BACT|nr:MULTISPECIES: hypothetical protein [Corallococcus]RKH27967.1 hypothetical protein D7X75_25605 [Corallococcus sp. CA031C]RKH92409.1 hypothetical protein D7Y13_36860 [Corallococcus praedator]
MPSSWFDVPFLFCRLRIVASYTVRENTMPSFDSLTTRDVEVAVSGAFRLQAAHGLQPYFRNEQVSLHVRGRTRGEFVLIEKDTSLTRGATAKFAGTTTAGLVALTLFPGDKHEAQLALPFGEAFTLPIKSQVWETYTHPKGTHTNRGTVDDEFSIGDHLTLTFPEKPGEVRLDKAEPLIGFFPDCKTEGGVRLTGLLRLTADIPAFHLADDTLDANPIPHCRVRVLCPDGVEREYESDEAGDIFIPRADKGVYTLVEVLHDRAPQSAAVPGAWSVDVIPDMA